MPRSPHIVSTRSSAWSSARAPIVLGALAAAALVLAALLDRSDPVAAAQNRVELEAAARADSIRTTWAAMRASREDIVPLAGRLAALVPDRPAAFAASRTDEATLTDEVPSDVAALLAAARSARGREEHVRSEALLANAELRAADTGEAALAHVLLERARVAGKAGDEAALRGVRASLATLPGARVGGTSAALLGALVEPVDPGGAFAILLQDPAALAPPGDSIQTQGGAPRVHWDPWWEEIGARLKRADPGRDWDRALRRDERTAEAVRALAEGDLAAGSNEWTLTRRRGVLLALRRVPDGVRAVAVTEASLTARLAALDPGAASVYTVRFDHEDAPEEAEVRPLEWLDGTSIGFSVHAADPLRAGRRAARRLELVRAGLVGLALAILCATFYAARAVQRARRLERLRSTFVASVSHDLRTPIQSILLMAETLERGRVAGEASQGRYFSTIRQEAQRLRRFVEDVLDGARLDQGEPTRVHRTRTESEPFFAGLERGLQERAERDAARVTFVRGALPEWIDVDSDAVLRIVWNLFENALRHGRVPGEPAEVQVTVSFDAPELAIAVQDAGPGIDARYSTSVFEPFERAEAEERGTNGTGLGLAIVAELARAHGGAARLAPSAAGARFEATLHAPDADADSPQRTRSRGTRRMNRILVVEDELPIRMALVDTLRAEGFEVIEAPDGGTAVNLALVEDPDAILLDLNLPVFDGFEVLRRIREDRLTSMVLILSARGAEMDRIQGFEYGADDYVVKPFSTDEVVARLRAALARRGGSTPGVSEIEDVRSVTFGAVTIDFDTYSLTHAGERHGLSRREMDLLRYLLKHDGETLSRDHLVERVWGPMPGTGKPPTTRTVDQHVMKLRKKIEASPEEPRHLVTVHGVGYRFRARPDSA